MGNSHLETLDLNADMGESYGNWVLSEDRALMEHLTTANVACGFHAGEPAVMRRTVEWATEHGVKVGAHPGTPDLLGFGRRFMSLTPDDVFNYVTYQVGALSGFLNHYGEKLHHVKPHGAMYLILKDEQLAAAAVSAIQKTAPGARFYWPGPFGHEPITKVAADAGMQVFVEAYPDLDYSPEGNLIVERHKKAVHPDLIEERVTRLLEDQTYLAVDGTVLPLEVQSICIHSDGPNSIEVAQAVKRAANASGVELSACE